MKIRLTSWTLKPCPNAHAEANAPSCSCSPPIFIDPSNENQRMKTMRMQIDSIDLVRDADESITRDLKVGRLVLLVRQHKALELLKVRAAHEDINDIWRDLVYKFKYRVNASQATVCAVFNAITDLRSPGSGDTARPLKSTALMGKTAIQNTVRTMRSSWLRYLDLLKQALLQKGFCGGERSKQRRKTRAGFCAYQSASCSAGRSSYRSVCSP